MDLPLRLVNLPLRLVNLPLRLLDLPLRLIDLPLRLIDLPLRLMDLPLRLMDLPLRLMDLPLRLVRLLVFLPNNLRNGNVKRPAASAVLSPANPIVSLPNRPAKLNALLLGPPKTGNLPTKSPVPIAKSSTLLAPNPATLRINPLRLPLPII